MKKWIAIIALTFSAGLLLSDGGETQPKKGETLFKSSELLGGKGRISCAKCHTGGKNFQNLSQTEYTNKDNSLEKSINKCITDRIKGKKLNPKSQQMKDLISYVKVFNPAEG